VRDVECYSVALKKNRQIGKNPEEVGWKGITQREAKIKVLWLAKLTGLCASL